MTKQVEIVAVALKTPPPVRQSVVACEIQVALSESPKAFFAFVSVVVSTVVAAVIWGVSAKMSGPGLLVFLWIVLCVAATVGIKWYFDDFEMSAAAVVGGFGMGTFMWALGGWVDGLFPWIPPDPEPYSMGTGLVEFGLGGLGIGAVLMIAAAMIRKGRQ